MLMNEYAHAHMHAHYPRLSTYRRVTDLGGTKKCPNASSFDEKVEFPAVYFFFNQ